MSSQSSAGKCVCEKVESLMRSLHRIFKFRAINFPEYFINEDLDGIFAFAS